VPGSKAMRLNARVEVNNRCREVRIMGNSFAQDVANVLGATAMDLAKLNVAPGSGPGPHPHRPQSTHIDTGALRDSLHVESQARGFLKTAILYTDLEYGAYLEMGWTTKGGTHYRYPWLMPAVEEARLETEAIARSSARKYLAEIGSMYRGRVNLTPPTSATFFSEIVL